MRLIHIYSIGLSALLALKNTDTIHYFPVHNFQPPSILFPHTYASAIGPASEGFILSNGLYRHRGQEALVGLYLGKYFYMDAHYIRLCECCFLNFVPEVDLGDCGYTL